MARGAACQGKPSGSELGPGGAYWEDVLAPAEGIYSGNWQSGTIPPEVQDYELMREMGWSWADLDNTPLYVRRFCWDLSQIRRQNESDRNPQPPAGGRPGR